MVCYIDDTSFCKIWINLNAHSMFFILRTMKFSHLGHVLCSLNVLKIGGAYLILRIIRILKLSLPVTHESAQATDDRSLQRELYKCKSLTILLTF